MYRGQAISQLAAIVNLTPFRNRSVLEDGRVRSIYAPIARILTELLVTNHLENEGSNWQSASL